MPALFFPVSHLSVQSVQSTQSSSNPFEEEEETNSIIEKEDSKTKKLVTPHFLFDLLLASCLCTGLSLWGVRSLNKTQRMTPAFHPVVYSLTSVFSLLFPAQDTNTTFSHYQLTLLINRILAGGND